MLWFLTSKLPDEGRSKKKERGLDFQDGWWNSIFGDPIWCAGWSSLIFHGPLAGCWLFTRTRRFTRYLLLKKVNYLSVLILSLSVRFLHELVPCIVHTLVNLYVCFCKSDTIYCLGIISHMMMQIQYPQILASKGSISVLKKWRGSDWATGYPSH